MIMSEIISGNNENIKAVKVITAFGFAIINVKESRLEDLLGALGFGGHPEGYARNTVNLVVYDCMSDGIIEQALIKTSAVIQIIVGRKGCFDQQSPVGIAVPVPGKIGRRFGRS
jgi:hypothetical protein